MSRAGGQAHDTAQTFLNERERGIVDRDLRPAAFVINRHLPRIMGTSGTMESRVNNPCRKAAR